MGTFDRFFDADGTEVQTKAFGRRLGAGNRPGDAVVPRQVPADEGDGGDDRDRPIPGLDTATYQAEGYDDLGGVYINVVDGVYTGITSERDLSVPLISSLGRLVEQRDSDRPLRRITPEEKARRELVHDLVVRFVFGEHPVPPAGHEEELREAEECWQAMLARVRSSE